MWKPLGVDSDKVNSLEVMLKEWEKSVVSWPRCVVDTQIFILFFPEYVTEVTTNPLKEGLGEARDLYIATHSQLYIKQNKNRSITSVSTTAQRAAPALSLANDCLFGSSLVPGTGVLPSVVRQRSCLRQHHSSPCPDGQSFTAVLASTLPVFIPGAGGGVISRGNAPRTVKEELQELQEAKTGRGREEERYERRRGPRTAVSERIQGKIMSTPERVVRGTRRWWNESTIS